MSNGIRVDAVNKSMRKIASDLMDKDPTFVVVFEETAYDTMLRGEDTVHRQNYKDGDEVKTRTWSAWEGNYVDMSGNPFEGEFTPRRPSTVNDIRRRSKNTWYNRLKIGAISLQVIMPVVFSVDIHIWYVKICI